MMMQNAQMHQMVMQKLMLGNLAHPHDRCHDNCHDSCHDSCGSCGHGHGHCFCHGGPWMGCYPGYYDCLPVGFHNFL